MFTVSSTTRTKRHQIELTEAKLKIKQMVFMQSVTELRNFLPQDVVNADGLQAFG